MWFDCDIYNSPTATAEMSHVVALLLPTSDSLSDATPGGAVAELKWHRGTTLAEVKATIRSMAGLPEGTPSRRREFCNFADIPSPSILKHLLKVEGGAAE